MSQSVAEVKNPTPIVEEEKLKPGQKYPTPAPGNGDRVFYETLYQQKPESEMAQEWCVAYGVLSESESLEIHNKVCKRKGKPLLSSPMVPKSSKVVSKGSVKPRRIDNDMMDDGFGGSGGWERQGQTSL